MGLIKRVSQRFNECLPAGPFEIYTNLVNRAKGHPLRISMKGNDGPIGVVHGHGALNIVHRDRLWNYKKGVDHRIDALAKSYLLHRISQDTTGAFIDCGANIGELGLFAKKWKFDYFAFEPEDAEADCCDLNNFDGMQMTNRVALWKNEDTLSFYSKSDTADSSLIEINQFSAVKTVKAIPLDKFVVDKGIEKIAVMKIEAEGAEPEILEGAQLALSRTRYLTVDCGFERGVSKESTLVPVVNIATKAGFKLVDWNPSRVTVLFENSKYA
ncbi:FkbM family methyltransferase [Rhizobium sp. PAMB 3174]